MSRRQLPNPARIYAEFDAQPPLMRPEVVSEYIGRDVNWSVTLAGAREERPGQAFVSFHFEPHSVRMIGGEVSLSEYPQLKLTHVGHPIHLRGKIRKIDTLSIQLEISKLVFAEAHERAHSS